MRRYLHRYGPATPADIAFWFGERVGAVKSQLSELRIMEVECEGVVLLALNEDRDTLVSLDPPRYSKDWPIIMLYRFDPLTLAHKAKRWIVPAAHYSKVWSAGGNVAGVILHRGVAITTWHYRKKGNRYSIEAIPFPHTKISQRIQEKIARHEEFLARCLK